MLRTPRAPTTVRPASSKRGSRSSNADDASDQAELKTKEARKRRSRSGCLTCRRRKQKCGEERPKCSKCANIGLECVWPVTVPIEERFKPYNPLADGVAARGHSPSESLPELGPSATTTSSSATSQSSTSSVSVFSDFRAPSGQQAIVKRQLQGGFDRDPPFFQTPTSVIDLAYPNAEERSLLQHYLVTLPSLWSRNTEVTKSAHRPVTLDAAGTYMPAVDLPRFLSTARGASPASDALALAILSGGATHISHLHRRTAAVAREQGQSGLAHEAGERAARFLALSRHLDAGSYALQNAAILMYDPLRPGSEREVDAGLDFVLATCVVLLLSKILAGDSGWERIVDLGKTVVTMRGGPEAMLTAAERQGGRASRRRTQAALGELFQFDVVGSIGTGRASSSLDATASWYLAPGSQQEVEAVEHMLGVSRVLFTFLNRVNVLYANSRSCPSRHPRPVLEVDPQWVTEAMDLMVEVGAWRKSIARRCQSRPAALSRTDYGDTIFSHMIEIIMFLDILRHSSEHPVVQKAAQQIIELFERCAREHGPPMTTKWPLVVAGSVQPAHPPQARARFSAALDGLVDCCCLDLDSTRSLLEAAWASRDAGHPRASWRDVAPSHGRIFM